MRVKCIENKNSFLMNKLSLRALDYDETFIFSLQKDKEYIVYAMIVQNDYVWYYICDEDFIYYPVWNPCPLFKIVDNRLSRYWVFTYQKGVRDYTANSVWAYPEWAEDPDYYEKLIEGFEREVTLFRQYQKKMDLEFPDSSITVSAQIGDEQWLICPHCIDAWHSQDQQDALVECPKCKTIFNNPRYINVQVRC